MSGRHVDIKTTRRRQGKMGPVPSPRSCSAREHPEGLVGDVTLVTANDGGLRLALGQSAVDVGDCAWFVVTEAGHHDPPDRVVGVLLDAIVVERSGGRSGLSSPGTRATPQSIAHAPSEVLRSGLSPAATSNTAAVSAPTPKMFKRPAAPAFTSGSICSSSAASSASSATNRRPGASRRSWFHAARHHRRVAAGAWLPR